MFSSRLEVGFSTKNVALRLSCQVLSSILLIIEGVLEKRVTKEVPWIISNLVLEFVWRPDPRLLRGPNQCNVWIVRLYLTFFFLNNYCFPVFQFLNNKLASWFFKILVHNIMGETRYTNFRMNGTLCTGWFVVTDK
jgi:hypothetical protein